MSLQIIKEYYEQINAITFNNLANVERLLKRWKLPKTNKRNKKSEQLHIKEVESIYHTQKKEQKNPKKLPQRKTQAQMASLINSTLYLRGK